MTNRPIALRRCEKANVIKRKDENMAQRTTVAWIAVTLCVLLIAIKVSRLLSLSWYPDLERDARYLGIYLAAREHCGFESPIGWVDAVAGKYDFDPPATQSFNHALGAARSKEAAKVATLSKAETPDYCERIEKKLRLLAFHQ